jgi:hypothetical protein
MHVCVVCDASYISAFSISPLRYAFNIIFNLVNKSALNSFPCPWFISTLQLGEGGSSSTSD